jgi:peptidoglycan/xylan/chitin deacetylase (PgdA/CDA1 family)
MRSVVLFLCLVACSSTTQTPITKQTPTQKNTKQIAITIDDLPWVGGIAPNDTREAATKRLLQTLTKYNTNAFGFVTCKNIAEGEEKLVEMWLQAGFSLGNHTYSHRAIDDMPLDEWLADVARCEEKLSAITGKKTTWFRYPQLRMGKTPALREQGVEALTRMGFQFGHVTVDTSEWLLTGIYQKALAANDNATAEKVVVAYQEHMLAAVKHYEEVAQAKLGRSIPQVLLLHANALAADHFSVIIEALQREGYTFISFDEAMRDPVYQLSNEYAGVWGVSWLNRIAPVAADAAAWDKQQISKIEEQFNIQ